MLHIIRESEVMSSCWDAHMISISMVLAITYVLFAHCCQELALTSICIHFKLST